MSKSKHIDPDDIEYMQYELDAEKQRIKNQQEQRGMKHKREIHDEPIQVFTPSKGRTR
jgi:hypothetical protein